MSEKDSWTTDGVSRIDDEWHYATIERVGGEWRATFKSSAGFEKRYFPTLNHVARHLAKGISL